MTGREARDRRPHHVRLVQDLLREEAESRVACRGSGSIAPAVLTLGVPRGVVGLAVAFDDEPPLHDEVDAIDEGNSDLGLPPQAKAAEHEPHDRFRPGFCCGVDEPLERSESARQPTEDIRHLALPDQTGAPRAVQRSHKAPRRLTLGGLYECLWERRMYLSRCRGARSPMRAEVRAPVWQTTGLPIELHVQPLSVVGENASLSEEGEAVETTSVLHRAQHVS